MNIAPAEALTLRLEQTIRASRERVFDAWTQPEHIKRWSAPEGMAIPEAESDPRVGGKLRVAMVEPNGTRHVFIGEYREIDRPVRLVYTHSWFLRTARARKHLRRQS